MEQECAQGERFAHYFASLLSLIFFTLLPKVHLPLSTVVTPNTAIYKGILFNLSFHLDHLSGPIIDVFWCVITHPPAVYVATRFFLNGLGFFYLNNRSVFLLWMFFYSKHPKTSSSSSSSPSLSIADRRFCDCAICYTRTRRMRFKVNLVGFFFLDLTYSLFPSSFSSLFFLFSMSAHLSTHTRLHIHSI